MKVLFATTANDGHFGPLVSLARAFVTAGHEVRVTAPASFATTVTNAGFTHVPFSDAPPELIGPVMARLPSLSYDEADTLVVGEVFGRIDAQAALPGVTAAIAEWRPDLVIREPAEFGSLAAAVRAGIPHLQLAAGMAEACRLISALTVEPLAELGALAGLPDGAIAEAAKSERLLSSVPDVLDRAADAAFVASEVAFRYRDESPATAYDPLPEWGDPAQPLVYVTFGSVAGSLPPFAGVFREALDAVADLPIRVFMTVGRRVDLAGLGTVPGNARVVAWWPQSAVLDRASALWGHGGFGTTMGAIAAGLPQVVTPLFTSDQRVNGRHIAGIGAGLAFGPGPSAIRDAAEALPGLLADPAYAATAGQLAAAIADLPSPAAAVSAVHRLIV